MGWFICLFISYLPFQAALRIMDSFFVHGVTILYKSALTIMYIYRPKLLAQKDGYMVASMLKTNELDITAEDLFLIMDREFKDITVEMMENRRRLAKYAHIREVQSATKNSEFTALLRSTKFTPQELEALYLTWIDATKNDSSKAPVLNFKAFTKFMAKQYTWWSELTQYERNKLFVKLTPRQAVAVTFSDIVLGLDAWVHGGLVSLFTSCFRLFDYDDDDHVTFEQLVRAFDLLHRLATHPGSCLPTNLHGVTISASSSSSSIASAPSHSSSSAPQAIQAIQKASALGSLSRPTTPDVSSTSPVGNSGKDGSSSLNGSKEAISSATTSPPNIDGFCVMIFDKLEVEHNQKVSFMQVKQIAFDSPLFVGFFGVPA